MEIKLNPGETICDLCNGKGFFCFIKQIHITKDYCLSKQCPEPQCSGHEYQLCPKCRGHGKLDWIEKIVGKKREGYYHVNIGPR